MRTQNTTLTSLFATVINVGLWPVKAWGLADDEMYTDGDVSTGYLCSGHLLTAVVFTFISGVFALAVSTDDSVALWTGLGTTFTACILVYVALGVSLRHLVDKRCRKKFANYDYVAANLNLL